MAIGLVLMPLLIILITSSSHENVWLFDSPYILCQTVSNHSLYILPDLIASGLIHFLHCCPECVKTALHPSSCVTQTHSSLHPNFYLPSLHFPRSSSFLLISHTLHLLAVPDCCKHVIVYYLLLFSPLFLLHPPSAHRLALYPAASSPPLYSSWQTLTNRGKI